MSEPQILIVEDNWMDVFLIRQAREAAAVSAGIHALADDQAATAFFDHADTDESAPCPALVLLDMNLPKKSGAEVLKTSACN